ncbi:cytochrome P450 family 26 subfamily C member 1 S homeolog [Xenopus laevis]|uniref:Cytochrome P450 family 26 subfamily C member 1 S homeolog n=1 Tax=Xenopus laevis TaxID=8355 RepID=Q2T9K4_XENLA|nr:cytochrome P450 family 26 subfamily C member 1 S homeolog [Xenopus laevis]AAI11477.1 MGC131069 protein [Xenopus laevis]
MFLLEISYTSFFEATLTSVLSLVLLLAASHQLWSLRWHSTRDRGSTLPLPKGSMGWPFFGETLHWLVQGSSFHSSRREKYGNVFKTHLLGKPVIRVTGAENIRKILLGEHSLVSTQWPQSTQMILGSNTLSNSIGELHRQKRKVMSKVLSSAALECYFPRIQEAVRWEVRGWCRGVGPVSMFACAKALTFRIASRILLGLSLTDSQFHELARTFEQLVENLFSLPLDIPFSGLRKGIKARDTLHQYMEEAIKEKLTRRDPDACEDALDYLINSAKEGGKEINMQELKESAIELLFAAFLTTASASTSLVLLLLKHPSAILKMRQELASHGFSKQCQCLPDMENPNNNILQDNGHRCLTAGCQLPLLMGTEGHLKTQGEQTEQLLTDKTDPQNSLSSKNPLKGKNRIQEAPCSHDKSTCTPVPGKLQSPVSEGTSQQNSNLEKIKSLHYLECVVKEVLRLLPPVSGGYRTALQTFELDGYQIPKGWSVMYSIRDTHETAAVYQNAEMFDPERFSSERDEGKLGKFNYIPFGGGVRSCIGKELAKVILKILAMELVTTAKWELATPSFPKMQTVPVVHPVDGLQLSFSFLSSSDRDRAARNGSLA